MLTVKTEVQHTAHNTVKISEAGQEGLPEASSGIQN